MHPFEKMIGEERRKLEQLAGMSSQDAKGELIQQLEEEARVQRLPFQPLDPRHPMRG